MQRRAEEVDAVPAIRGFVGHAFLYGVDSRPGSRVWPGLADVLAAVIQAGEALIGDALVLRHTIGTGVAEAAVIHVPAVQQRAGCQGVIPGERGQATGGTITIDQLEELPGELLRFTGGRRGTVGSVQ